MSVEKEALESRLTASDRRRILQSLGFKINGEQPNEEGSITDVLGPPELGEGRRGNFRVNVQTGWSKDFGSSGWEGSLYDAVMDVRGCTFPEALEWAAKQIGYRSNGHAKRTESPLSLERLAKAKGLPPKLLQELGVKQIRPGKLRITYRDTGGNAAAVRQRLRTATSAKDGSRWEKGSKPIVPYGLWLLNRMLARHSYGLMLEGESDSWTAWKYGLPALGIPGKSMHRALKLEHVEGFDRLYVGIEADEAGREFARNMHERLQGIGYEGDVYALPFSEDAPDLNDLYRDDPARFEERLERMMEEAPALKEWLERNAPSADVETDAPSVHVSGEKPEAVAEVEALKAGESLEEAPPLPGKVYDRLPLLLGEAASAFQERHERDVFLSGALPCLSACMPGVEGYYGHVPNALSPHQYVAVVAGAAGGKGALKPARRLTMKVDEFIKEKSEDEQRRWKEERERAQEKDEPFDRPEPPKRSLLLPANTSAAAFHEGLKDRDERALVVETEIDTLTNALGQEWGKCGDTLRKSYHHERTAYRRKGEGNVTLDGPALSVVLSGTPNQFRRLMGSTENGLYSRFALYYFDAAPRWISQRPTADALRHMERFEEYARRVLSMWKTLARRAEPLRFRMTRGQWAMHDKTFPPLLREANLKGRGHMSDVIKRAGVAAFRIAMTLTVLRAFESGAPLSGAGELLAEDVDVQIGLALVTTYADHAMRFAEAKLQTAEPPDPSTYRIAVMLEGVGDEFTSGEAYEAAEAEGLDVSSRTLGKDLAKAEKRKLVRNTKKGHWKKTRATRTVAAASDVSDASDTPTEMPRSEVSEVSETAPLSEKAPEPERSALGEGYLHLSRNGSEKNGHKVTFEKHQLVQTPKGIGRVVRQEGNKVHVELDDARIGETESFDPEDVEPLRAMR